MADIADAGLSPVLGILNGVQNEMSTAAAGEKDSFAVAATSLAVAEDEMARSSTGTESAAQAEWRNAQSMPWDQQTPARLSAQ